MSEENSVFHIVLPFCIETEFDVFLTILKYTVARSKFTENDLICAFMSAMKGDPFCVKMKDLTLSWEPKKTDTQQMRQMKLLGFWAIVHFPSLGKKLFGEAFQPSQRNGLPVIGSTEFEAENIDKIVSSKMKLRVIELTVNKSTYSKLKFFVKVPVFVCATRNNELRVSRKMVSFDVDQDYVKACWEALISGEYEMDSDNELQDQTVIYPCVTTTMDEIENEGETPLPKRVCRRRIEDTATDCTNNTDAVSTIDSQFFSPVDVSFNECIVYPGRNCQIDNAVNVEQADGSTNCDSLRAIVFQIREDIGTLSTSVQNQGSERLHIMIINQKDAEISRLNDSCNELRKTNEKLLSSHTSLEKEITHLTKLNVDLKDNAASYAQLSIETELLRKRLTESDIEIASNKKASDYLLSLKAKSDLVTAELLMEKSVSVELNAQLRAEVECLGRKLAEAEKAIHVNEKINYELDSLKKKSSSIVTTLSSEIEHLAKINSESAEKNAQLEQELCALKHHANQGKVNVATQTNDRENFSKSSIAPELESSSDTPTKSIGSDESTNDTVTKTDPINAGSSKRKVRVPKITKPRKVDAVGKCPTKIAANQDKRKRKTTAAPKISKK